MDDCYRHDVNVDEGHAMERSNFKLLLQSTCYNVSCSLLWALYIMHTRVVIFKQ